MCCQDASQLMPCAVGHGWAADEGRAGTDDPDVSVDPDQGGASGSDVGEMDSEGAADAEDLPQRDQSTMHSVLAGVLASHNDEPDPRAKSAARQKAAPPKSVAPAANALPEPRPDTRAAKPPKEAAAGSLPNAEPSSSQPSTTVFVRGLPLDVTQQQLHARLQAFGAVASCRLVLNKATQKPKGTAFVEFREAAAAQQAAAACEQGRQADIAMCTPLHGGCLPRIASHHPAPHAFTHRSAKCVTGTSAAHTMDGFEQGLWM